MAIDKKLKDPKLHSVTHGKDGQQYVIYDVRAKNSFGAYTRYTMPVSLGPNNLVLSVKKVQVE